jgi:hypothetical protein
MRINQLWAVHKWLPVFAAMPKMIIELIKNRQHGMIGIPRTFVSGRLIQLQQYWRSYKHLEAYASNQSAEHLPAWKRFNKAARNNQAVGIYHETYLVSRKSFEAVFVGISKPVLSGDALGLSDVDAKSNSSRARLGRNSATKSNQGSQKKK